MTHFEKVKNYLLDLGYEIMHEDTQEELVIIRDEQRGLINVIVDCEDPILIVEMYIMELTKPDTQMLLSLLQKNREIVHGAFAIDQEGKRLFYRDTLQLENLDLNELEATLDSLSLLLSEFYEELISFSHQ